MVEKKDDLPSVRLMLTLFPSSIMFISILVENCLRKNFSIQKSLETQKQEIFLFVIQNVVHRKHDVDDGFINFANFGTTGGGRCLCLSLNVRNNCTTF